jgi:predicted nucleotidyltransferase
MREAPAAGTSGVLVAFASGRYPIEFRHSKAPQAIEPHRDAIRRIVARRRAGILGFPAPCSAGRTRDAAGTHRRRPNALPEYAWLLSEANTYNCSMKPSKAIALHRDAIRSIVARHRALNPRIFGSALRGEDTEGSDLDLLVDPQDDTSLFDLGAIQYEVQKLIGVPVDVLTPGDLPESFRERVIAEAAPL